MESPVPIEAEEVLQFWLSETPMERRFVRDKALDAAIRERFGALHARLAEKVPQEWRDRPRGLLAAVIVLDQFSRNLYRDDPRAFAQDEAARALMREALDKGWDRLLGVEEKWFLYMPLMHSEDLADQELSVELYRALGMKDVLDFAIRHRDQIACFGRFPQRNDVLERDSTAAEAAFLKEPGSRF
ncbi:hypothetical protein BSL82_08030 [Tardibacter chloracetimidivorans]|uniref:DUF924 domain-containing protein n=1 Tax=Tardibacter chloracetimidivorans TaxID=1921510 RepID=A0A1L3ZUE2_9SPHN|nr:hypothetical protein BSL82_08030 [Tardibacter chloracetimidivorans]